MNQPIYIDSEFLKVFRQLFDDRKTVVSPQAQMNPLVDVPTKKPEVKQASDVKYIEFMANNRKYSLDINASASILVPLLTHFPNGVAQVFQKIDELKAQLDYAENTVNQLRAVLMEINGDSQYWINETAAFQGKV